MKTNCLIIISCSIILLFLFFTQKKNNKQNTITKKNLNNFVQINSQLDEEHDNILNAIDNLYNLCKIHWNTEDKLFKKGLENIPQNHKDIKDNIETHIQHHNDLLNQISEMKKTIINHIEQEDAPQFHWTK